PVIKQARESFDRFNSEMDRRNNPPPEMKEQIKSEPMATPKEIKTEVEYATEIGVSKKDRDSLPLMAGLMPDEIKETVDFLHKGKIPPECWNNENKVWKIAYIDQPGKTSAGWRGVADTPAPAEHPLKPKSVIADTIRIFAGKNGERPAKEERNLNIAHEIYHRNEPEFMEIMAYHGEEWEKAVQVQMQKDAVSEYSVRDVTEEKIPQELLPYHSEFQAEQYAYWATDSSKLCQEMYNFFDKHFPKRTT
ncbi:hypothetical protein KKH26_02415, partial [Patescibacteria group bacterium]|nr:hypothetical protein [Patescibacteria group bacterium]